MRNEKLYARFVIGPTAVLSILAAGGALADTADESSMGLETIVVSARKVAENAQKVPIAMTTFSAADLQNSAVQNLVGLAPSTPSLFVSSGSTGDPSTPFVSLRGQVQTTIALSVDNSVGMYSDGIYSTSTTGSLINHFLDVDRIEILKGPQGTLYGRNTTGGAINVYTKLPDLSQFSAEATLGAGNYTRHDESAVVNLPLVEGFAALRVAAGFYDRNGFGTDLTRDRDIGDEHTKTVRATLEIDPNDLLHMTLRAAYTRTHDGGFIDKPLYLQPGSPASIAAAVELGGLPPTPAKISTALAQFNQRAYQLPSYWDVYNANPATGKVSQPSLSATLVSEFDQVTLKSISAYEWVDTDRTEDDGDAGFHILSARQHTRFNQFTQELQATGSAFAQRLKYALGAYYYLLSGDDTAASLALLALNPPTNPNNTNAHVHTTSPALYAQNSYALTSVLNLTVGVRWTHETKEVDPYSVNGLGCQVPVQYLLSGECRARFSTVGSNVSYTGGFDWTVAPDTLLYVKTSRGYKSGGINQRISANPLSVVPYEPEQVTDYEGGIKSQWFSHRLQVNADYYRSNYRNIQRTVNLCAPTCLTITKNAAAATINGVELEMIAAPADGVVIKVGGAYTDAGYGRYQDSGIDQSFQAFQNTPRWTYSSSAAYTRPTGFGEWHAQLDWSWRGAGDLFPSDGPATVRIVGGLPTTGPGIPDQFRIQSAYGLLGAQAGLHFARSQLDVRVYGKNLTDRQYISQAVGFVNAGIGLAFAVPGEPRTFGIEVSKRF